MAEEEETEVEEKKPMGALVAAIIGSILTVVLTSGAVFFLLDMKVSSEITVQCQAAPAPASGGGDGSSGESEEEDSEDTAGPPKYHVMKTFTVNLPSSGRSRYLKVDVKLMSKSQVVADSLPDYDPMFRDALNTLFASQKYKVLKTTQGQIALKEQALTLIQGIMKENTGKSGVNAVYFTDLVMQ
jgi:flagellar protein FliL